MAHQYIVLFFKHSKKASDTFDGPNPSQPTVLWNAMIYPFLNMTIKGAIWYQGESNAGEKLAYLRRLECSWLRTQMFIHCR